MGVFFLFDSILILPSPPVLKTILTPNKLQPNKVKFKPSFWKVDLLNHFGEQNWNSRRITQIYMELR